MSFPKEAEIKFADSSSRDAFGRARVGNPFGIFDFKAIYNVGDEIWEHDTNGAGASISHSSADSTVDLVVGTASGEYAIRQTGRYFAYIPGKSHIIIMTGVFEEAKEGLTQRIGYFDDDDGLFFELVGTTQFNVVKRSSSPGTTDSDEDRFPQTDWNLDKLDGSGPSGIDIDITTAQIFVIDFQWLGVGRIRFGFEFEGGIVYCHEISNANKLITTYMSTPSLPCRYEIRNTSTVVSASTLKAICQSVFSEGGYVPTALEFTASNGVTTRGVSARTPILAVRLKNSFGGKSNRRTLSHLRTRAFASNQSVYFELAHLHAPSSITADWNDVGSSESAAEYSTNISAVTGNPGHTFDVLYASATRLVPPSVAGNESSRSLISQHAMIYQNKSSNNSQMWVVYATPFAGTANVAAAISWAELD